MAGKGRPLKFKKEYIKQGEVAAREGFTDAKLAKLFGVNVKTIYAWKNDFPDFCNALKKGKDYFNSEVIENDLKRRATGFRFTEVTKEAVLNKKTGKYEMQVSKSVRKLIVPDVTAQIFWLKNRDPERWRDKKQVDLLTDSIDININFVGNDDK